MVKGPCLFGANLTDPWGRARFRASSQTFCPWVNTSLAGDLPLAALFSAAMACFLRCLNWSTRALAAGLSELELWSGVVTVLLLLKDSVRQVTIREDLVFSGEGEGESPHRLIRRLERKCGLDTKDST